MRDQLSLSEIAKRTGLSRNTVKKWLKAPVEAVPKHERGKQEGKLTAFEPTLQQALTTDSHRPKHSRRSASALFAHIQAQGYRGGYLPCRCRTFGNPLPEVASSFGLVKLLVVPVRGQGLKIGHR
ncbi:transposase [Rhodoferax ferrireducens]|uniref:Transposase n=1 Tax=Rhodoferax ferrireducens TaxID=192843 RepID=A0ABU2CGJ9_9BURK|nr:helix-turn-helix domain-containing protein [Rhodoferax ferrireducens]MDR7380463.1 transposase [Rhodoferax ferrireducens]